jgi:hypothetical protein
MASQKMIPPKRAGELNEPLSNLLVFDFFGFFLRLEKIRSRASSTICSADKTALTKSDCGALGG